MNQRWRDKRDSYRPAGEVIATSEYEVAPIAADKVARGFVEQHHYSASFPAARFRYGLYRGPELAGVAVFSVPVNDRALAMFPGSPRESIELGRFVLLDNVPGNGETWFLARCFELLRPEGIVGVLSFSDPTPRTSSDGTTRFKGHLGTIYQAHNALYYGRAKARTLSLLPDGRVFHDYAAQKIRSMKKGWRYAVAELEAAGAPPLTGDPREWLRTVMPQVTRPLKHPGNHRYAWVLNKRNRKHMKPSMPYPKNVFPEVHKTAVKGDA